MILRIFKLYPLFLSYKSEIPGHILNHPVISKKDMKEYHTTEKYDKVKII